MISPNRSLAVHSLRAVSAISLLLGSMTWSMAQPSVASAEDSDPDARLEVIFKNVHVFDDNDWWLGGEMTFGFGLVECKSPPEQECQPIPSTPQARLANFDSAYVSASSGEYATFNNLTLPKDPSQVGRGSTSGGFEVKAGTEYVLWVTATEEDLNLTNENGFGVSLTPDSPGAVVVRLRASDNWHVGNHVVRAVKGESTPGDYDIAFEIRRPPLPDLVTSNIGLRRLDDGRDAVCFTYGNVGPESVGTFAGQLRVDGVAIPGGSVKWPRMDVNESRESCVVDGLPLGRHTVSFDIDPERSVPEYDEKNNHIEQLMTITSAVSPPTGANQPTDAPNTTAPVPAALSVTSIRIRGEDASGANDCDPGDNRVTVAVKNAGETAIDVIVRLIIDDDLDKTTERSAGRLESQRTADVTFDNIPLSTGEHALTARVLASVPTTETDESDNRRRVTFNCKEEG